MSSIENTRESLMRATVNLALIHARDRAIEATLRNLEARQRDILDEYNEVIG